MFDFGDVTPPAERSELSEEGEHLCRIIDVREKNGYKGHGFFIDFEVAKGPSPKGEKGTYMVYPDNAQPFSSKAGKYISKEQAVRYKKQDILRAVAACAGIPESRTDEVKAKYQIFVARPVSPLAGRFLRVDAYRSKPNHEGKTYMNYRLFLDPSQPAWTSDKAASPLSTLMAEAGWEPHPDNDEYAFNPKTNEVLKVDILASKLS